MHHHNQCCPDHFKGPFRIFKIISLAIGGLILAVVLGFIFGYVVQRLWNWLMPALFSFKTITYWQAFGIVILGKLIFGGCGHHGSHHHKSHWKHWDSSDWAPHGDHHNWKYYEKYWKEEGKAAFESYLDKIKKEEE